MKTITIVLKLAVTRSNVQNIIEHQNPTNLWLMKLLHSMHKWKTLHERKKMHEFIEEHLEQPRERHLTIRARQI